MRAQTVEQIIRVLRRFRDRIDAGESVSRAFQDAVRSAAEHYDVFYQTIEDGCTRRLGGLKVHQFETLLAAWIAGNPQGLVQKLKKHSDKSAHRLIDELFQGSSIKKGGPQQTDVAAPVEYESISFRLPTSDARMLRALAELRGIRVNELAYQAVAQLVQNEMTSFARRLVGTGKSST